MWYVTGADLPPLLWHPPGPAGTTYDPKRFISPGIPGEDSHTPKPTGGLWTSPAVEYEGKSMSAWKAWSIRNGWYPEERHTPLAVHPHYYARILVIHSLADAQEAHAKWPMPGQHITESWWPHLPDFLRRMLLDWPAMAETTDAVCLTSVGVSELNTGFTSFATWDTPTVYWLNPAYAIPAAGRPGKPSPYRKELSMSTFTGETTPVKGGELKKGQVIILAYVGDDLVPSASPRPRTGGTYLITEDPRHHRAHKRNQTTGRGSSVPAVLLTVRPIAPRPPHSIGPDTTVTVPSRRTVLTTQILDPDPSRKDEK